MTDGPTGNHSRRSLFERLWWVGGLAVAAIIVVVLAPLASPDPDGLERVAEDHGFLATARDALYSIIPDYVFPGLSGDLATVVAGLVGVAIVFLVMVILGRALVRRRD